jgi:hypothetical protein
MLGMGVVGCRNSLYRKAEGWEERRHLLVSWIGLFPYQISVYFL